VLHALVVGGTSRNTTSAAIDWNAVLRREVVRAI
jgi:hypothetical protein